MLNGILSTAMSALGHNAQRVSASADNIANVSTPAYKPTRVDGTTLTTRQTSSTAYAAGGVQSSPRQLADLQGLLTATSSPTDMAIAGEGYFPVQRGGSDETLYTRDGSFKPDAQGRLVNGAGDVLLGSANEGGALAPVSLNAQNASARATQTINVGANLPADAAPGDTFTIDVQATDSLGRAQPLELTFTAQGDNTYQLTIDGAREGDVSGPAYDATLEFDGQGQLTSTDLPTISVPGQGGADALSINLDASSLTRFAGDFTIGHVQTDGARFGTAQQFSIAPDGALNARFDNGETAAIAHIPVATFANPGGLEAAGAGAFRATDASGEVTYRTGGSAGAGSVQGNALEASATDLGQEFANMIVAQSAYSASLKTLSAGEDMTRQLLDVKG